MDDRTKPDGCYCDELARYSTIPKCSRCAPVKGLDPILRTAHDQPPPAPEDKSKPAVWPLVVRDMCDRDVIGRARYGTPLQPHNGRDALKDAYAEALDLAVYLRQAIFERDGK